MKKNSLNLSNIFLSKIVFPLSLIYLSSFAVAQSESKKCTDTNPRFCIGEVIAIESFAHKTITYIAENNKVQLSDWPGTWYETKSLAKTTGCGKTNPRFCINETVVIESYKNKTIVGIHADGTYLLDGWNPRYSVDLLSKTRGRGQTTPSFCVGETITIDGQTKLVVGYNPAKKAYSLDGWAPLYGAGRLRKTDKAFCSTQTPAAADEIVISLSLETGDVVEAYQNLARVTSKERSEFLKSIANSVGKLNSGGVNVFAGFLFAKIVRSSTAQVVKDKFEPAVATYVAQMEKTNWTTPLQVEFSDQMVEFATHVVAAGVRTRNTQAALTPQNEIRLKALANAAAKKGTLAKANALKEFLSSNMNLIEDLVADPRHGAIGSLVADTAQWVNKQSEE